MKCTKCNKRMTDVIFNDKELSLPVWSYCKNKRCTLYNVKISDILELPEKENWLQKLLRRLI